MSLLGQVSEKNGWDVDAEKSAAYLQLAATLQKTDRILTGSDDLRVLFFGPERGGSKPPPAYTDAEGVVHIESTLLTGADHGGIDFITILGLNYHEVCHVLFSPGYNQKFRVKIAQPGLHYAWNCLEDQRIESLFCALYGNASGYFMSFITKYILSTDRKKDWGTAHILLHGRKYVPKHLRNMARKLFTWEDTKQKELEWIIDSYLTISHPDDDERAFTLVKRFSELMMENAQPANRLDENPKSCREDAYRSPDPMVEKEAHKRLEEQQGEEKDQEDNGKPKDTKERTSLRGKFQRALIKGRDTAEKNKEIKREIAGIRGQLANPDIHISQTPMPYVSVPVDAECVTLARQLETELTRITAEVEPRWLYGSDTGRLNVARAMRGDDPDELFDEWEEGREQDTELELVILLDLSGSMDGPKIYQSARAMWALKRGAEQASGTVTVLGFSHSSYVLYAREDRAERATWRKFEADGGTSPGRVLETAHRVLTQSTKRNKMLVAITDGQWPMYSAGHQVLENLVKTMPGTTVFLSLGGVSRIFPASDWFHVSAYLERATEIFPVIRRAATKMVRDAVR